MTTDAATIARRTSGYAVAWRGSRDDGVTRGSIELDGDDLVLRGSLPGGRPAVERVPLDRIAGVRVGRGDGERLLGEKSMILDLAGGGSVAVAPLGAAGAVLDLAELVAALARAASLAAPACATTERRGAAT